MSSQSKLRSAKELTHLSLIFCFLSGLSLIGCASGRGLQRIDDAPLVSTESGKDISKFEVREQVAPQSAAAVSGSPDLSVEKGAKRSVPPTAAKLRKASKKAFAYPKRRPKVDPIWIGEKSTFDINYLGVNAGQFTLKTLPFKEINGRKVYHIFGEAISNKVFSLFYSLKDTIESFIDYETISPHRFHIVLDESKQKRNSLELYDSEKGETFFWNRWNHHKRGYTEVKQYFPMQPFSQDSLSSLFYLRTLDLSDGAVLKFPVISEGKNWDAEVTVVRREKLDTPMGRMPAIVLKPETKYQGILQKQGDSFIWLSDDERRILLRLEAKVKIGTVVAALTSFEPGVKEEASTAQAAPGASR